MIYCEFFEIYKNSFFTLFFLTKNLLQVFSCKFYEFFIKDFLKKHLWATSFFLFTNENIFKKLLITLIEFLFVHNQNYTGTNNLFGLFFIDFKILKF